MKQAGFSIVEVMIAAAIMAIIALAMTTMMSHQYTEMRAISQKQDISDFKNYMLETFTDPNVCSWQVKGKVLDLSGVSTTLTSSAAQTSITTLYQGLDALSGVLASTGAVLPDSQTRVVVASIKFTNIYATGNPNEYRGVIEIGFDGASLVRPLRPVKKPVTAIGHTDCMDQSQPPPYGGLGAYDCTDSCSFY